MNAPTLALAVLFVSAPAVGHSPSPEIVQPVARRVPTAKRRREPKAHAVTRPPQASGDAAGLSAFCPALRLVMEDYHPCQR